MDDFYIIAQENGQCSKDSIIENTGTETQVKSLTKFLRNITGGTTASSNSVGSGTTTSSTSQMVNHVQLIIYLTYRAKISQFILINSFVICIKPHILCREKINKKV